MSKQTLPLLPETFDKMFGLLMSDAQFKERFYSDPEQAVRDAGISLTFEEPEALRDAELRRRLIEMETFDERLVLCSSAGY